MQWFGVGKLSAAFGEGFVDEAAIIGQVTQSIGRGVKRGFMELMIS